MLNRGTPVTPLSSDQAAKRLGVTVPTLYDWLSQSDAGEFVIRGQSLTISYFQGGRRGQGRIQIDESEIDRLRPNVEHDLCVTR